MLENEKPIYYETFLNKGIYKSDGNGIIFIRFLREK